MPARHDATQEVIRIALDSADSHISCCFGLRDVQPNRDVLELRALQLVDGARITWPDGVGRDVSALFDIVCDRVDRQMPVRLRLHVHALGIRLVRLHNALHAVDEISLLVHVASDVQPHALVQLHVQRHRRSTCEEPVLVFLRQGRLIDSRITYGLYVAAGIFIPRLSYTLSKLHIWHILCGKPSYAYAFTNSKELYALRFGSRAVEKNNILHSQPLVSPGRSSRHWTPSPRAVLQAGASCA